MNIICDVIILTWDNLEITKKCIESFLENTKIPTRLIVIDNNSNDGTKEYISFLKSSSIHKVEVVLNTENKGFVGGMNQGLELSTAPYVCLANNDLIFTKNWLSEVISVFEKDRAIGVLNPNSNNLDSKPAKGVSLADYSLHLMRSKKGVFVEMPFCIGFCMVIKRDVINIVGGLSEEFQPLFFEDTDYSLKAKDAGFLIGMASASYVWHTEHASVDKLGSQKKVYFQRSKKAFLKKWGKTLRVAWVIDGHNEIKNCLPEAVNVAREGNFIWIFVKNLPNKQSRNIFLDSGYAEHLGVKIVKFNNIFGLAWNILKKKKKYDILISKNEFIKWFFGKLGFFLLKTSEIQKIKVLKRRL